MRCAGEMRHMVEIHIEEVPHEGLLARKGEK